MSELPPGSGAASGLLTALTAPGIIFRQLSTTDPKTCVHAELSNSSEFTALGTGASLLPGPEHPRRALACTPEAWGGKPETLLPLGFIPPLVQEHSFALLTSHF